MTQITNKNRSNTLIDLLKLNTANSVRTHETSGNINNYGVAPKIIQHIKSW